MSKTIYINEKAGDDAHDGLTPETAFLTREEVMSRAAPSKSTILTIVWDGEAWCTEKETEEGRQGNSELVEELESGVARPCVHTAELDTDCHRWVDCDITDLDTRNPIVVLIEAERRARLAAEQEAVTFLAIWGVFAGIIGITCLASWVLSIGVVIFGLIFNLVCLALGS